MEIFGIVLYVVEDWAKTTKVSNPTGPCGITLMLAMTPPWTTSWQTCKSRCYMLGFLAPYKGSRKSSDLGVSVLKFLKKGRAKAFV